MASKPARRGGVSPPSFAALRRAGGLLLLLALGLTSGPGRAHDVKDPVCRMTTDSDTTPFRETVGGKTYFFCSETCQARFDKAPSAYVSLAGALARGARRVYTVALSAPPRPRAHQAVPLTLTVRERPSGRVVRDYELVHQEHLHLLLVSSDLTWFEHQHPRLGADGRFRLAWVFPKPGRYYLFSDFTPADGDNQVIRTTLNIGLAPAVVAAPRLVPDARTTTVVGDTRVTLTVRPGRLRAGHQSLLTYTLSDRAGRPRTDLQPILGVMGHLIALRDDGRTITHTHALHGVRPGSYGAATLAMRQAGQAEAVPVRPEWVTLAGPSVSFKLTPPRPGRYRLWAQFQRRSQWLTVPFTVEVD